MQKKYFSLIFILLFAMITACGNGGGNGGYEGGNGNGTDTTITTNRVSINSVFIQGNNSSSASSISSNGRYVVFESLAINLVSDDTNAVRDIFIHDRDADGDGIFDESNL